MRILSKALVLFWAAVLMVSSTCFGADIHYCQGEAQTFGIYEVAKPCKMHKKKTVKKVRKCCVAVRAKAHEARKGFPVLENSKCCYNDQVAFKTDGEHSVSSIEITTDIQLKAFIASPQLIALNRPSFQPASIPFRGPPDVILHQDFQSFFQVFRI